MVALSRLFVLWASVGFCSSVPASVYTLLAEYFSPIRGNYLYFCSTFDAMLAWKEVGRSNAYFNVRSLTTEPSWNDSSVMDTQTQRIGIFVDLTCPGGISFLYQNMEKFNSTYRWMLLSEDLSRTVSDLSMSKMEGHSDVIVVTPGDTTKAFHVTRFITQVPMEVKEKDLSTLSDPSVPLQTDFGGGACYNNLAKWLIINIFSGMLMVDIKFNESNLLEPLLDRSFAAGEDQMRRFGLSVFLHLAEFYNFSMTYVLTDTWGDPLGHGKWTGMVGQIERGEAEFGVAPAKYIVSRYDIVDYATSLHIVRVCFTFLQPKLFGTYKALVLPLDASVWFFLGLCTLASIIAFRILVPHDKTSLHNDGWGGSSFLVIAAIANQGIPDNTNYLTTRIVYLVVLMISFFVGVYYNTAILNGLLLQAPNAIQNVEQLLHSDIRIAMIDYAYFHEEMTHNDTLTVRVRNKMEKHKPPHYFSVEDGVAAVKKGQFAIYTEATAVYHDIANTFSDAEICSMSEVEKYRPFHVGAVARFNSPYRELFNRGFTLMRERGVVDRQTNYWLLEKPECHWKQDALSLGLEPMFLAYACIILGALLSALIFFLEKLHHKGTFRRARNWIVKQYPTSKMNVIGFYE